MREVDAIYNAVRYVEKHLRDDITIGDMANAANYSLYHFCRLFNRITRFTPYEYLVRRRIDVAAEELRNSNKKIIEIAFDLQFNSPESFIRAFRRVYKSAPGVWKKQLGDDQEQSMPAFEKEYLYYVCNNVSLKPKHVKLGSLELYGILYPVKEGFNPNGKGRIEQFLDECKTYNLLVNDVFGVRILTKLKNYYLFIGAEIKEPFPENTPFVKKMVNENNYIRIAHKGAFETLRFLYQYEKYCRILEMWKPWSYCIEKYNLKKSGTIELFVPVKI